MHRTGSTTFTSWSGVKREIFTFVPVMAWMFAPGLLLMVPVYLLTRRLYGDTAALVAALFVIEQGHQAVIMAPTEVLARQHGASLTRLCEPLGVSVETLTGSTPSAERNRRPVVRKADDRSSRRASGEPRSSGMAARSR